MRRQSIMFASLLITPIFAANSHALEKSATNEIGDLGNSVNSRISTVEAALTAALNAMSQRAETCALKDMFYIPSSGSADADGCVDSRTNKCAKLEKLYLPTASDADRNGCVARPNEEAVPAGTIAAFASTSCPSGWSWWSPSSGRFLVGYGSAGGRTYQTINGVFDTAGDPGQALHRLTLAEMPAHRHEYVDRTVATWRLADDGNDRREVKNSNGTYNTGAAGGNQPHENRPPFRIVYYCRKD